MDSLKQYLKIIGLLAIAAGLFILLPSFCGKGKFRTLDYSHWFMDTAAVAATEVPEEPPMPAGPDTSAHKILLFGDSMIEGLRFRMSQYCVANGHELQCVIWYSSSSKYWARGDTVTHFIRKYNPTYLFISMGANELFVRNLDEREAAVKRILQEVGNIPYIWIGPPNWKPDTGINRILEEQCGPSHYYPSLNLRYTRSRDGCHPDMKSYNMWADSIATWLRTSSAHPIRWETPDKDTPKTHHVQILRSPKD